MVITSVSMIPQNHVASKFVQYSCGCFISSFSISPKGKKFSSNLHHVGIRAVSREIPFMQKKFSIKKQSIQDLLFLAERLIFNLFQIMIHPTIPKFPKFSSSFPSLHTISLNFSPNCFSLPPRFCPTCHWRVLSNEAKGSSIARVTRYRA